MEIVSVETVLGENPLSIQKFKDWLFISVIDKEIKVQDIDLLHFFGEERDHP